MISNCNCFETHLETITMTMLMTMVLMIIGKNDDDADADDYGDDDDDNDDDDDAGKVFDLLGEEKLPCTLRADSNGNMQVSVIIF